MRDNTERPVTVDIGSNVLAGTEAGAVQAAIAAVIEGPDRLGEVPEFWDGHAAVRICETLSREL